MEMTYIDQAQANQRRAEREIERIRHEHHVCTHCKGTGRVTAAILPDPMGANLLAATNVEEYLLPITHGNRMIVDARSILTNYLRSYESWSWKQIGKILNKDHSTVIHYNKRHDILLETDLAYIQKNHIFITLMAAHKQHLISQPPS